MEKIVSSNSSSIIFLAKLNSFYLAKNLFKTIFISEQVKNELFKYERSENNLIQKEIDCGFIKIIKVKNLKNIPIHLGEKSAISLCFENKINVFLSDDKKVRIYARSLNLKTLGVIGIILENLKFKKINSKKSKDLVEELIDKGYYMDTNLYLKILRLIKNP